MGKLELRLDNTLARLGLAATRAQSRQFICHGHVLVDGGRVDIAFRSLEPGQEVRIRPGSRGEPLVQEALDLKVEVPPWLELDRDQLSGRLLRSLSPATAPPPPSRSRRPSIRVMRQR